MMPPRLRPADTKHALRFVCSWTDRPGVVPGKVHALMQWLQTLDGLAGGWFFVAQAPSWNRVPVETVDDVEAAVADGRGPEGSGLARQWFFLGPFHSYVAEVRLDSTTSGEAARQQLHVVVHPEVDVERARLILVGLLGFFKPAWAAVGPERTPPRKLTPDGPASGWLVYLSSELGLPSSLPASASVTPVGALGWLVQAHPERARAGHTEHALAAGVLEAALRAGTASA